MLDDGLLERFPFSKAYGLHNIPGLPAGQLLAKRGGTVNSDAAVLRSGQRTFLRYWSVNVALVRACGWPMPGFAYSGEELDRIATIARAVPRRAVAIWICVSTLIFILLATAVMLAVVVPVMSFLWPDPATTSGVGFAAMLALVIICAVGLGLPLSIGWGGAIADRSLPRLLPMPEDDADAALYAKVRTQFRWFGLFAGLCFAVATITALVSGAHSQ